MEGFYPDLTFFFYATKILPTGEGGLISLSNYNKFEWIKEIKNISENRSKLKKLSINGIKTARKYTWEKRVKVFIKEYGHKISTL